MIFNSNPSKSFLAALLTTSIVSTSAFAFNPNPIQDELAVLQSTGAVAKNIAKFEVEGTNFSDFEWVQEPRLIGGKAIQKYMAQMQRYKEDVDRIGGPGTKAPWAEGYYWQKVGRAAKKTISFAWNVIEPYAVPLGARLLGDIALGVAGPYLMERSAQAAASVASALSSWWTPYVPYADQAVRATASTAMKGEFMRDAGTLMGYVELYSGPVYRTIKKGSGTVVSGVRTVASKVGSSLSSAWGWMTGSKSKTSNV